MNEKLTELRKRIDELDRQLLDLLTDRAEAARIIGELKAESGTIALDPGREREVLARLLAENAGRFPPAALTAIFREIISASRALEAAITVGYLGHPGGFSELAARRRFGSSSQLHSFPDAARLFAELDGGRLQYALLARDAGDEDPALDSFDLFLDSRVTLFGEFQLPGGYVLAGRRDEPYPQRIYAHPNALNRCRELLARLPQATAVAARSSEEALASLQSAGDAALVPGHRVTDGEFTILEPSAEDEADPVRRFLILSRTEPAKSGNDRTALVCVLPNQPGSLANFINLFAGAGVNVAWIEIRESRHRPWEHAFFVELDGHLTDPDMERALEEARLLTSHLHVLGSFPLDR